MSSRRRRGAIQTHEAAVRRLLSCVTHANVATRTLVAAVGEPAAFLALTLNRGEPTTLRGKTPLSLRAVQHIRLSAVGHQDENVVIVVVGYIYSILLGDGAEVVSYHWHPHRDGAVTFPHAHFGPAAARRDSAVRPGEMHKVHFPTGYVALEDVLRLAITEFAVEPRRADWQEILNPAES